MLDQPVPNPLAKNPNVHTHKVFASVGLILIGTIIAVAGIWYYLNQAATDYNSEDIYKTATSSAKKSTTPITKDEVDGWKTYTNNTVGFQVKYPPTWKINESSTNNLCSTTQAFFAPNEALLGKCASGFGGLISVSSSPTPGFAEIEASYSTDNYEDFKKETVSLGGKAATRVSGTSKIINELVDERGTRRIVYLVELGASFLSFSYSQDKNGEDYSKEFEQMVSTFKFL